MDSRLMEATNDVLPNGWSKKEIWKLSAGMLSTSRKEMNLGGYAVKEWKKPRVEPVKETDNVYYCTTIMGQWG